MARYFFDIHDGREMRDNVGTECATLEEAYQHAREIIPEIAAHEIPAGGDRQAYTVLATNEQGRPVYTAALSFLGLVLTR
jgi:hypothetical protein